MENTKGSNLKKLVIVGDDLAAWQSALSLLKLMRFCELDITVLSVAKPPQTIDADELISASPTLAYFHHVLGVSEQVFMQACDARFLLADKYAFSDDSSFFLGYSESCLSIEGVSAQHLIRLIKEEAPSALSACAEICRLNLATEAARRDRFSHPNTNSDEINQQLLYGYSFSSRDYRNFIRKLALDLGVKTLEVNQLEWVPTLSNQNGDSSTNTYKLVVERNGRRQDIDSDLFLDCVSVASESKVFKSVATIHSRLSDVDASDGVNIAKYYHYKSRAEPDVASGAASGTASGIDASVAHQILEITTRSKSRQQQRSISLTPQSGWQAMEFGYVPAPWEGNRINLGTAASQLGELAVAPLQLIQSAILRLVDLFPTRGSMLHSQAEFNALSEREFERVVDFHLAQLHAPNLSSIAAELADTSMGHDTKASESFRNKLAVFKSRGELAQYESESISKGMWVSFLVSCGVFPQQLDPIAAQFSVASVIKFLEDRRMQIQTWADGMLSQSDYLKRYLSTAPLPKKKK